MSDKNFYCGVVESRDDPLKLGRVRVRIAGCHTPDTQVLPTTDLPWATVLDANRGIPREGSIVSVEFWDYPDNQMPVVTGVIPSVPQRDSIFIDKGETTPLLKDTITPNGRPLPKNNKESSGGLGVDSALDPNNAPEEMRTAIQKAFYEMASSSTSLINSLVNETTAKIGGIGSAAQLEQTIGSTLKSKKEELLENISKYGDLAKAQLETVSSLSEKLGTSIPKDLLNGNLNPTSMMSGINGMLKNLTNGLGADKAASLVNNLSSIDSGTIGSELTSKVSSIVDGTLGSGASSLNGITSGGVSKLTDGINSLKSLNIGNFGNFSGLLGNGLNSLTSELSNITSSATSTISDSLNKVSGLTSGASVQSLIGGISVPAGLNDLVSKAGNLTTALTEKANEMIGKGFTSTLALSQNIGGAKTVEEAVQKIQNQIKDLKDTNVSVTKEAYEGVEEKKSPPTSGTSGGANYGGANATNETPSKQDTVTYSYGSTRSVDTSWVTNKGDIDTIVSVAKENGITTTESLSAYLAIIYALNGGFSQCFETTNYSETELKKFFPITFSKASSDTIREYSIGKKSDKDFLSFVYDSANDGITYGNQYPSDGGLYYGYGYIKIIGRSAYTRYAKILNNLDLITKGAEALKDKSLCAKVSALEFLERTKTLSPTAHPHFFYQACSIFGIELGDAEGFYCNFYGAKTQDFLGVNRKMAGSSSHPSALYVYGGDETLYGFKDPRKKYPNEDEVCESSLSKLSRGDIRNSVVSLKESHRRLGVPLPMNMGSWDQPHSSYGAVYPFNKVEESESGHVIEVDDTPNRERLHWYHKSGTFTEIDESGVKVNRIVGDGYTIVDRNGFVSIEGEADVTVGGNVNIYCRSNANIQVEGTANLEVGRNLDIGVAKDVNIRTEGNFNVWANGDFNLQAKNNGHILASNNLYQAADKNMYLLSGYVTKDEKGNDVKNPGNLFVESYGNSDYRSLGNTKLYTAKNLSDHVIGNRYNEVKGKTNNLFISDVVTKIGGLYDIGVSSVFRTMSSNTNIKSSGDVYIDGTQIRMNEGKSVSPTSPISEEDFKKNMPEMLSSESVKALIHGMIPPQLGTPLNVRMGVTEIQMPGNIDGTFEDARETSSTLFNKLEERTYQVAGSKKVDTGPTESVKAYSGSGEKVEKAKGRHFPPDYPLSKHFFLRDLTTKAVFPHPIPENGQMNLTEEDIVTNLKALSVNVLEKVLDYLPNKINGLGRDWTINSGFRIYDAKKDKGKDSQHFKGQAVDIQLSAKKNNVQRTYDTIKAICEAVPFDQAILEYSLKTGKCWMHLSYNDVDGNRPSENSDKIMTMHPGFKKISGSVYKTGLILCKC